MKNLSIRIRVILCFIAAGFLLLVLGAYAVVDFRSINGEVAALASDSLPGEKLAAQIQIAGLQSLNELYQVVNAASADARQNGRAEFEANRTRLTELFRRHEQTLSDETDRERAAVARTDIAAYFQAADRVLRMSAENADAKTAVAALEEAVEPAHAKLMESLTRCSEHDEEVADASLKQITETMRKALIGVAIGVALGLLLGGFASWS